MAFPTSPTNGQIYNNMKFSSTLGLWKKSDELTVDQIIVSENPQFLGHGALNFVSASGSGFLKAETIITNMNSAYNTSTGEFTCPIEGNYLCYFDALIKTPNATSYAETHFRKNNIQYSGSYHTMHDIVRQYEPLSTSTIVYAAAGDKISLWFGCFDGGTIYSSSYCKFGFTFVN